jgi:Putative Ig domain
MLQLIKKISLVLMLAFGLQTSWAFSLLGPDGTYPGVPTGFGDAWQVGIIGYNGPDSTIDNLSDGPKNIGEEYRHNTPVMYYACDSNFLLFFGLSGSDAIDQAFAILNNSMTNNGAGGLNGYSTALTEFPLNSQAVNYQASAMNLRDLKSETLTFMMEQLGLADPVRYVWGLHNRFQIPNSTPGCPFNMEYEVVMRNFDITASPLNQLQYSPYVNASLYTYFIEEVCNPPNPLAITAEFLVDPLVNNPPVSSLYDAPLQDGSFYTGLTRDDVAGLRYLLDTNNVLLESPALGSVLVNSSGPGGTNYGAPFVLFTSDLTTFILAASTNAPAILTNLYPGLIINSSILVPVLQKTTNFIAFFTNQIGAPIGSPQKVVVVQIVTTNVLLTYVDTFANVVTNHYHANTTNTLLTVTVAPANGAPAGSPLQTNITSKSVTLTGVPSGDFYINTNACGPDLILSDLLDTTTAVTNLIVAASNTAGLFFSQSQVSLSNSSALFVEPIVCGTSAGGGTTATNAPGLYQGIGKIQFVKTSFDSLIGNFWQPITNTYNQVLIDSTGKRVNQTFQRILTQPDVLLTASDQLPGPSAINNVDPVFRRSITFDLTTIAAREAGPGVIENPTVIDYNKVGPVFLNLSTAFLSQSTALTGSPYNYTWASFDGSTNAPTVYPNGTSIDDLENLITVQISPPQPALPDGNMGVAYPATTFTATGGAFSPPFTWSLPSGGLPPGLTLSSGGTISGTPTQTGTFDFTVQMTDSLSRSVSWSYSITIN